ncbi:indolepyruvate ferredoxin oxidoreductase family protein, partial [Aureimonas populi]
ARRAAALAAMAGAAPDGAAAPRREAYFCSGCPHSVSTRLPEGSRATTGIGCHMMVIGVPDRNTATFTQMGGEGGGWIGLSPFTDEQHIFVNMGDGTYFHSGLLAIRAAIAARVNATYKILYNDAVAMTGGQRHDGENTVPSIVDQLLAEGARRVVVVAEEPGRWQGALPRAVAIHPRDELDAVQRELREIEGVTAIVYDQVCAAEKRRRRKRGTFAAAPRRAFINDLVCEGCGDCSAVSNCISVEPLETELGRKRRINQSSCNTDLSCLKGFCPSFVTVEGGALRKPPPRAGHFDPAELPQPALAPPAAAYNMLLAGIGGTGVITVSAILSMAAHLDGLSVLTLDQTGLAQKNGAVVSHVRLAPRPDLLNAARIGAGEADLVLGFDVVVAASPKSLASFGKERTRAVVDDHFAPTAAFVQNTAIDLRQEATLKSLRRAAGEEAVHMVSATRLGTALMGDAIAANMFLLGHAWQRGLVPVSREAIDRAMELNGAGLAMNRAAFAWGRRSAVEPGAVTAAAGLSPEAAPAPRTLGEIVARRAAFLTAYQDAAYAARYAALVETARRAEDALPEPRGFALAVAASAFRLMAYKDEYEVARLHRDPSFKAGLAAQFEGDFKIRHLLAPPMIARIDPRTGHPAKIAFGPWVRPVFGLLARLKWLRGTRFDPFGRTPERRMERRLIEDYASLVERLSAGLSASNLKSAVELAALPGMVRGFGHVKAASVARYEARRGQLMARLDRVRPPLDNAA